MFWIKFLVNFALENNVPRETIIMLDTDYQDKKNSDISPVEKYSNTLAL